MLHTHIHTGNPSQHPRPILPTFETKLIDLVMRLFGFVLVATLALVWWAARAPSPAAPLNGPNRAPPGNANAATANVSFEQDPRNLAASNSPKASQILYQPLEQDEPLLQRGIVLSALKDASSAVLPALMTGLNVTDAGVCAGAAQVLDWHRSRKQAVSHLAFG